MGLQVRATSTDLSSAASSPGEVGAASDPQEKETVSTNIEGSPTELPSLQLKRTHARPSRSALP